MGSRAGFLDVGLIHRVARVFHFRPGRRRKRRRTRGRLVDRGPRRGLCVVWLAVSAFGWFCGPGDSDSPEAGLVSRG